MNRLGLHAPLAEEEDLHPRASLSAFQPKGRRAQMIIEILREERDLVVRCHKNDPNS
ncbi:hypothetical protein [Amycolatopsis orientalis]|uniref:hypothetical protein n=1 Tax=Amycolatopsis orientalis TaxID=31958 RepID=UPI00041D10E6|nr:hypothetical protein [Amycolatopsis orientalis]